MTTAELQAHFITAKQLNTPEGWRKLADEYKAAGYRDNYFRYRHWADELEAEEIDNTILRFCCALKDEGLSARGERINNGS